jgi:bifunctional non-homologous end joining protein LigD
MEVPFTEQPPVNGPATWIEPELVAEVKFDDWTEAGLLRAPVFLRLRDDVDPRAVKRAASRRAAEAKPPAGEVDRVLQQLEDKRTTLQLAVGAARIKLTHLDRVYWPADPAFDQPALTKRDLLRYLARVSRFMLPHLADRPLTMIRMPEGIDGERFFQKHWGEARPEFVQTVKVFSEHKGEQHEYLVCNDLATLLWLGQAGTLEFHVWHSRLRPGPDAAGAGTDFSGSLAAMERSVLNHPDYLVFDIDPYIYSGNEPKGAEPELSTKAFEKGKEVAIWLRQLLQSMTLEAYVKTSGKTGLHVFVPIERTLDFDAARHVCEMVGRHLLRQHPRDITMDWSVDKRTGKIFIDYNMNVRGKTLNTAYSPRGVAGAPVSMPLSWEELEKAHPLDFRLTNAPARLERTGDRWQNTLRDKQNLEQALERSPA